MKKILSLALVVAMLASMLVIVPTVGATEALATIEVTNAAGVAGDTVSVEVVVTTATMSGYSLFFEYDKTRLELVKNGEVNGTLPAGTAFAGALDSGDEAPASKEWTAVDIPIDEETGLPKYEATAPFENIFWNDTDATAHDCSNGVAAAVLTFKIKDDAAIGDAYVGFRYLCNEKGYAPNEIYSGTTVGTISAEEDINFKAGKITVLPEEYVLAEANSADDFTYVFWDPDFEEETTDPEYASYALITGYTGTDKSVVIPATIEGLPVGVIKSNAFKASDITSVVIPACVETVQLAAFIGCETLKDVYVLGSDTEFAPAAVGYSGSITDKGSYLLSRNVAIIMNGDVPMTTVHAPAGSGAATMATTPLTYRTKADAADITMDATIGYNDTSVYTVSFEDVVCYTAAETVAPGQMINGDKTVVAWKNGDAVVAPGAALTLTADTELEAIKITTPTLVNGVSIKVAGSYEDSAMRFTANLAKADYDALAALGTVTVGTIITPVAYVNMAGGLTKEALDLLPTANKYVDVVADGFFAEGVVAGSVRNFRKKNVDIDYAAALYVTVELADGTSFTVYSAYNYNANRNFGDSIAKAVNNGITQEQANILNGWIKDLT